MHRLSTYSIGENVLLTHRQRVSAWVGYRRKDFYVQRVETALYKRMGWAELHYIDQAKGTFNKGCLSLMFTDSKDRCIAYVALLNKTHKGCSNGMIVSRFVIAPQFQGRGYSKVILNLVGAMVAASGYILYFNTRLKWLGDSMNSNVNWVGSVFDGRVRKVANDPKYRNRTQGYACRKRYVGKCLKGFSHLFNKVNVLRERVKNCVVSVGCNNDNNALCTEIFHADCVANDMLVYNIIRCCKGLYEDSS